MPKIIFLCVLSVVFCLFQRGQAQEVVPPDDIHASKLQEKIWDLKRSGNYTEGEVFQSELLDILKNGVISEKTALNLGGTKNFTIIFSNGLMGIFKPRVQYDDSGFLDPKVNADAEVAAYEVDRLLGLDVVPTTVMRSIEGQEGSLQVWIPSSRTAFQCLQESGLIIDRSKKVKFLDYLIFNRDVRADNYLILKNGTQASIDHGLAFKVSNSTVEEEARKMLRDVNGYYPGKTVLNRLRSVSDQDWREALSSHLTPSQIKAIIQRREEYLRIYEEKGESDSVQQQPTVSQENEPQNEPSDFRQNTRLRIQNFIDAKSDASVRLFLKELMAPAFLDLEQLQLKFVQRPEARVYVEKLVSAIQDLFIGVFAQEYDLRVPKEFMRALPQFSMCVDRLMTTFEWSPQKLEAFSRLALRRIQKEFFTHPIEGDVFSKAIQLANTFTIGSRSKRVDIEALSNRAFVGSFEASLQKIGWQGKPATQAVFPQRAQTTQIMEALKRYWKTTSPNEKRKDAFWAKDVLYPMGGVDAVTVLERFPKAQSVILVGKERFGSLESLDRYLEHPIPWAPGIAYDYKDELERMEKKYGGVGGALVHRLMKQYGLTRRQISVTFVELTSQGKLVSVDPRKKHVQPRSAILDLEIPESEGKTRRVSVFYISENFLQSSKGFRAWIQNRKFQTLFLKAEMNLLQELVFSEAARFFLRESFYRRAPVVYGLTIAHEVPPFASPDAVEFRPKNKHGYGNTAFIDSPLELLAFHVAKFNNIPSIDLGFLSSDTKKELMVSYLNQLFEKLRRTLLKATAKRILDGMEKAIFQIEDPKIQKEFDARYREARRTFNQKGAFAYAYDQIRNYVKDRRSNSSKKELYLHSRRSGHVYLGGADEKEHKTNLDLIAKIDAFEPPTVLLGEDPVSEVQVKLLESVKHFYKTLINAKSGVSLDPSDLELGNKVALFNQLIQDLILEHSLSNEKINETLYPIVEALCREIPELRQFGDPFLAILREMDYLPEGALKENLSSQKHRFYVLVRDTGWKAFYEARKFESLDVKDILEKVWRASSFKEALETGKQLSRIVIMGDDVEAKFGKEFVPTPLEKDEISMIWLQKFAKYNLGGFKDFTEGKADVLGRYVLDGVYISDKNMTVIFSEKARRIDVLGHELMHAVMTHLCRKLGNTYAQLFLKKEISVMLQEIFILIYEIQNGHPEPGTFLARLKDYEALLRRMSPENKKFMIEVIQAYQKGLKGLVYEGDPILKAVEILEETHDLSEFKRTLDRINYWEDVSREISKTDYESYLERQKQRQKQKEAQRFVREAGYAPYITDEILNRLASMIFKSKWRGFVSDYDRKQNRYVVDVEAIQRQALAGDLQAQIYMQTLENIKQRQMNMKSFAERNGMRLASFGLKTAKSTGSFMLSMALADSIWSIFQARGLEGLENFIDQLDDPEFYHNYFAFSFAAGITETGYLYLKGANQYMQVKPEHFKKLHHKAQTRGLIVGQAVVTWMSAIRHHPDFGAVLEDPSSFELMAKIAQDVFLSKNNTTQMIVGAASFWSAIQAVELTVNYGRKFWVGAKTGSGVANTNPMSGIVRLAAIFVIEKVIMATVNAIFPYDEYIQHGRLMEDRAIFERKILDANSTQKDIQAYLAAIHEAYNQFRMGPLLPLIEAEEKFNQTVSEGGRYVNRQIINLERVARIENYQPKRTQVTFTLDGKQYDSTKAMGDFEGNRFLRFSYDQNDPELYFDEIELIQRDLENAKRYSSSNDIQSWKERYLEENEADPRLDDIEMALIQSKKEKAKETLETMIQIQNGISLSEIPSGLWQELWTGSSHKNLETLLEAHESQKEALAKDILAAGTFEIQTQLSPGIVEVALESPAYRQKLRQYQMKLAEGGSGNYNRMASYFEEIRYFTSLNRRLDILGHSHAKQKLVQDEIEMVLEQWQQHEVQLAKEVYHLDVSEEMAARMMLNISNAVH